MWILCLSTLPPENPSYLKSSVKSLIGCHVICWFLVHCVLSSPESTQTARRFERTSCVHLLNKLYGDADFQKVEAPVHSAKASSDWFAGHSITLLDWHANSPDLNPPIENLWGMFKWKMRDARPNKTGYQSNLP